MERLRRSKRISDLVESVSVEDFLDYNDDLYDASCTTGYDNGGSTGSEIFYNGLELGIKAGNRPIFIHEFQSYGIAVFFTGEEDEIIERMKELLE